MLEKKIMRTYALLLIAAIVSIILFEGSYAWWNSSWQYRKPIIINNTGTADLTDYQVKIVANMSAEYADGKINVTCQDLRFTWLNETSGNEQEIPYWIEYCNLTANDNITVWVKVPEIPANSTTKIYMYYGNPDATSESNGDEVFEFFIDGNDAASFTCDSDHSITNASGEIHLTSSPGSGVWCLIAVSASRPAIVETRFKTIDTSYTDQFGFIVRDDSGEDNRFAETLHPQLSAQNEVQYYSGGTLYTLYSSFTFNTYYRVKYVISDTVSYYLYDDSGSLLASATDKAFAYNTPTGNIGSIAIGDVTKDSAIAVDAYISFIFARKFADPEPTTTIGNEETTETVTLEPTLLEIFSTQVILKAKATKQVTPAPYTISFNYPIKALRKVLENLEDITSHCSHSETSLLCSREYSSSEEITWEAEIEPNITINHVKYYDSATLTYQHNVTLNVPQALNNITIYIDTSNFDYWNQRTNVTVMLNNQTIPPSKLKFGSIYIYEASLDAGENTITVTYQVSQRQVYPSRYTPIIRYTEEQEQRAKEIREEETGKPVVIPPSKPEERGVVSRVIDSIIEFIRAILSILGL